MALCIIEPDVVAADVEIANKLMYHPDWSDNPILHNNMVAFHSAQAIEKMLKYMIMKDNPTEYENISSTHSMESLILGITMERPYFSADHREINKNHRLLTTLNTRRYGNLNGVPLSDYEVKKTLDMSNALYKEFYKEYEAEFSKPYTPNVVIYGEGEGRFNSKEDIQQAHKEHINKYKMAHCIGVAECMRENANKYGLDPDVMYVVGLLHDVGYLEGRKDHELTGAYILKKMGVKDEYIYAIENHEQDLSKLNEEIRAETGKDLMEVHPELVALVEADMSVNAKGYRIGLDRRLAEIEARHAKEGNLDDRAKNTVDYLKSKLSQFKEEVKEKFHKGERQPTHKPQNQQYGRRRDDNPDYYHSNGNKQHFKQGGKPKKDRYEQKQNNKYKKFKHWDGEER